MRLEEVRKGQRSPESGVLVGKSEGSGYCRHSSLLSSTSGTVKPYCERWTLIHEPLSSNNSIFSRERERGSIVAGLGLLKRTSFGDNFKTHRQLEASVGITFRNKL